MGKQKKPLAALATESERWRRGSMMARPHMAPLERHLDQIRAARGPGCQLPRPDPCDGGVEAELLILFHSAAGAALETGFVSIDNPDAMAGHMTSFLAEAGIDRKRILIWNVVPWRVDKGEPSQADLDAAEPWLLGLLELLPRLRVTLLLGVAAHRAEPIVRAHASGRVINTWMPHPRNQGLHAEKWAEIAAAFGQAAQLLRGPTDDRTTGGGGNGGGVAVATGLPVLRHPIQVQPTDLDENGHVNNVVWVQWMQDVATAHSDAVGGTAAMYAAGGMWVARAHHIEYLAPAFSGDRIEAVTWVADLRRVRSRRRYRFFHAESGKLLARGETDWVYLDRETGRPRSVPDEVMARFVIQPDGFEPEAGG